jgi:hypothetical protein
MQRQRAIKVAVMNVISTQESMEDLLQISKMEPMTLQHSKSGGVNSKVRNLQHAP